MPDISDRLALPYLQPSQAQKHVTHNEALQRLDLLVQMVVEEVDAVTPPEDPADGGIWAVGSSPTGAWEGQAGRLAAWQNGAWAFVTPQTGWRAWDATDAMLRIWQGGAWGAIDGTLPETLQNLTRVGINATADATNPLTAAGDATLLTHAGAGHRLKVNKAGAAQTASLLYQNGYSGRAEMGLMGDDDFRIKVSPDGATFADAMRISRTTGIASFPARPYFSASAAGAWLDVTTTETDLAFGTAVANTGGHYDPATGRFTAPQDGIYAFAINGVLNTATDASLCLGKNGVSVLGQMQVLAGNVPLSFMATLPLSAGDYVTCRTGDAGTLLRYDRAHTSFSGWLL